MIIYSEQEGFISPIGVRFREGQDKNIVLPSVAVGVFSRQLFFHIVNDAKELNATPVGYISCANFERDVYVINYKGVKLTFFMAGIGGPTIACDIENLAKFGVKKFIIFGNCGVLDDSIEDCSIIIPTRAFRDEGTSQHFVPDSEYIDLNIKYIPEFERVLDQYHMSHTKGYTWTTDAIFRETPEKIEYFKSRGAVCVEMEAATISAVCMRDKLEFFTFYYAGDSLAGAVWDPRSISGHVKLDEKKIVPVLAFELACLIK